MTAEPDAYEQMTLELINRARMDPLGEFGRFIADAASRTGTTDEITSALRFFEVDLGLLKSQLDQYSPVAPLAWNTMLSQSATRHNELMIQYDQQSHELPGEPSVGARVQATGYPLRQVFENVFAFAEDPFYTHAAFYIDWGDGPGGIQSPAGHRLAIMNASVTEIGVSAIPEGDATTEVGPYAVTHHIAAPQSYDPQLVGVVIDDDNGNDFYDIGEGVGGVRVVATGQGGTFETTTWDAGGYQFALAPGTYAVSFSGAGVDYAQTVTIGQSNVKLDVESGDAPTVADDVFASGRGSLVFDGQAGFDTVVYADDRNDYILSRGPGSAVTVAKPDGSTDTLRSIEKLVFGDRAYDMTLSAKAAALPAATLDALVDLYVAYFNRVPEASGLSYWIDQYGVGQSLDQIAARFYDAGVTFSEVTGYTADMTLPDFVAIAYANVLDRTGANAPGADEIDYWVDLVGRGEVSREGMVNQMLTDARAFYGDADVGYVPELLDRKVELGKLHAVTYGLDYLSDEDAITTTVELAAAVTPDSIGGAVQMIGLAPETYLA